MSASSTLQIHTQMRPEEARPAQVKQRRRGWPKRRKAAREGARQSYGDRLLRNGAIACALLLGILALGNIRQPWAEKAAQSIEKALSMHINLDDSIGELTFVRQIMPESALVFLNVSGGAQMAMPAGGEIAHAWSAVQPWLMLDGDSRPVYATAAGTVTAVSRLSDGRYGLLVDHGQGLESVYANLSEASVQMGEEVTRAQPLGACEGGLYFELRQDGESIDPAERLGL